MAETTAVVKRVASAPDVSKGARRAAKLATTDGLGNVEGLIRDAIRQHIDPKGLAAIMRMRKELLAERAEREYVTALAQFQRKVQPVLRSRVVKNKAEKQDEYGVERFRYAPIEVIAKAIGTDLADCGFTYTFDSGELKQQYMPVWVSIRHQGGHERRHTFNAAVLFEEGKRLGMSANQVIASAFSFGCRQALIKGLGLMTVDPDPEPKQAGMGNIEEPRATGEGDAPAAGKGKKETGLPDLRAEVVALIKAKTEGQAAKRFAASAEKADAAALRAIRDTLKRMKDREA